MIRKFKIELEVVISNKGNLISEAYGKMPISVRKLPSLEEAIKVSIEQASYYIDVQSVHISNSGE